MASAISAISSMASSSTSALTELGNTASAAAQQGTDAPPFSGLMQDAVSQVNQLEAQANTAVTGLISGTGMDVHDAMIATQKASMAFELALSVRNKAMQAYQSVMSMQF